MTGHDFSKAVFRYTVSEKSKVHFSLEKLFLALVCYPLLVIGIVIFGMFALLSFGNRIHNKLMVTAAYPI
ncbi:hypothetical protein FBY50_1470 [Zymomonas mobilis]|nr:hypothetical protein FBY50_1470 [Zymomonas mobilis]